MASKRRRLSSTEGDLEASFAQHGVWIRPDSVKLTRKGVLHGLGAIALTDLEESVVLFQVPRRACFGASEKGEETDDETVDSQADLAVELLEHLAMENSPFKELVSSLPDPATYDDLLFLKPDAVELVRGTELEPVIQNKISRLQNEYRNLPDTTKAKIDLQLFCRASGVVLSHLNPFFGNSIAPFAYIFNCSEDNDPNILWELDEDKDVIRGIVVKHTRAGQEICQSYGNDLATTELIYRCGFVLAKQKMNDVVSIYWRDIKDSSLAGGLSRTKEQLLLDAGVLDASPWFGLDHLSTVEIPVHKNDECPAWFGQLSTATYVANLSQPEVEKITSNKMFKVDGLDEMDCCAIKLACLSQGKITDKEMHKIASYLLKARNLMAATREKPNKKEEEDEEDEEEDLLWEILTPHLIDGWEIYKSAVLDHVRKRLAKLDINACSDLNVAHLVSQERLGLEKAIRFLSG